MVNKNRKFLLFCIIGSLLLSLVACTNQPVSNTENGKNTEVESESEKKVEIADANDILTKVWDTYEMEDSDGNMYNDRFSIMGGHFESSVMDMPAKYDLTEVSDLEVMYCVPQNVVSMIDDGATMVHLMRANTFTAGVYHVTEKTNVESVVKAIKTQLSEKRWLDGVPDRHVIGVIDDQYVIAFWGTEEVVANFEKELKSIYGKLLSIEINEAIR